MRCPKIECVKQGSEGNESFLSKIYDRWRVNSEKIYSCIIELCNIEHAALQKLVMYAK